MATVVGDIRNSPNEVLRTWAVQGTHLGLGTQCVAGPPPAPAQSPNDL
jgi:hypothetical protein